MSFEDKALSVYKYQYLHNADYRQFIHRLKYNDFIPAHVDDIPFFPISLFKDINIKSGVWEDKLIFTSSGTTQMTRSQHHIRDPHWYLNNTEYIWQQHFGDIGDYVYVSLLPSYHDNPSSSLLYMVRHFMINGLEKREQYYVDDHRGLYESIEQLLKKDMKVVLFGVSFALLEYVETHTHVDAHGLMVVETGGMKKNRREITRSELHSALAKGFVGARIISEYGMTECLSQLYCEDGSNFVMNERMRVLVSDPTDPLLIMPIGSRGKMNIIDLANFDTMSFIATDDLGKINAEDAVEILGRLDASDLRGCNYLI